MQRRHLIIGLASTGLVGFAGPSAATLLHNANLRGSLDATTFGVRPNASDDQSQQVQQALDTAAASNRPVFLPPGTYRISNVDLPSRTRLMGISGTSRLIYSGDGAMLTGNGCELIEMSGITLDGANLDLGDEYGGLLHGRGCPRVLVDNCDFIGSRGTGVTLETCGGRFERSRISGASGLAALFAVNSTGLALQNNHVADCANGGLLVHRWSVGADNTIISGNRIERIAARGGGTGQRGNGINLFRAEGVIVNNNHISDCAFSAVRANSASNAQITGNTCLRSGETAIYAEFAFQGSIIANNIVDGATMGISIANFNDGGRLAVCANNLIRNLKLDGPYPAETAGFGNGIFAEADTSVTGNVIEGAPHFGIGLGWGPYLRNVIASDNIVRDAGVGLAVSVVDGVGKALISNNLFQDCRGGAIVGHKWAAATTGDLINNDASFPQLTLQGNVST